MMQRAGRETRPSYLLRSGSLFTVLIAGMAGGSAAQAGELAKTFHQQGANSQRLIVKPDALRDLLAKTDIDSVAIERELCEGSDGCPLTGGAPYTSSLASDGSVRLQILHEGKTAAFIGQVDAQRLQALFRYIADMDYFQLADGYSYRVSDSSSTYVLVKQRDRQKIVRDYAHAAPARLWALEQLIDSQLAAASWQGPKPW